MGHPLNIINDDDINAFIDRVIDKKETAALSAEQAYHDFQALDQLARIAHERRVRALQSGAAQLYPQRQGLGAQRNFLAAQCPSQLGGQLMRAAETQELTLGRLGAPIKPQERLLETDRAWLRKVTRKCIIANELGLRQNAHIPGIAFFDDRDLGSNIVSKIQHLFDWLIAARSKLSEDCSLPIDNEFQAATQKRLANLSHLDFAGATKTADEWFARRDAIRFKLETTDNTGEYICEAGNNLSWYQIKTRSQLLYEGRKMRHCVAGYDRYTRDGYSDIYSLRDSDMTPSLTVEIRDGNIVQAKGLQNSAPNPNQHMAIAHLENALGLYRAKTRADWVHDTVSPPLKERGDSRAAAQIIGSLLVFLGVMAYIAAKTQGA